VEVAPYSNRTKLPLYLIKVIYCSGKGIHLLIIILGKGEKLETKLGLHGEMEK
jgi:hypothetical protein